MQGCVTGGRDASRRIGPGVRRFLCLGSYSICIPDENLPFSLS